ncbi:hypothetical protein [Sulfuricystis multivorans]|uniref:hypothetical protein n=1 Tax=Sulfuricystis multivorans TaxID=2211108 RepID=UPI000F83B83E|nr:hypothetical protein [Sulfuricystis multivorans]
MRLPLRIEIRRQYWLARLLCRGDIDALLLGADGRLGIERRSGACGEAVLDAATTMFTGLVILRLRQGGRCETLVVPPRATGHDVHRRLRVWLRWRARPALFRDAA